MGTNVCVLALLLMACVAAVTCTNARPRRGCDTLCKLKSLTHQAGKRTKSVDRNQGSYPWNQGDTSPTYTADDMTKDPKSTCIFDEALKRISPKWQERLLSVLEGALMETKGKEVDDGSFGL
ncbi:uncharacterized protein LOC119729767 [Patiria miniata]|uniref:Uncharacterized protein n=1 Tax=Patiria miniata TaxID=46514 RepID=A0A914A4W6_PATMI|nr:uncharacterized protein LOC119729767 [Patiria miniata]XP_038058436.1 uncharacterized protein LOC119729767 [Patiria miniata]